MARVSGGQRQSVEHEGRISVEVKLDLVERICVSREDVCDAHDVSVELIAVNVERVGFAHILVVIGY